MKILIVTNSISDGNLAGGVEVVAKLHFRAFQELGIVCDLLAMNRKNNLKNSFLLAGKPLPKARRIFWSEELGHFSLKFVLLFFKQCRNHEIIHIHLCKDFATVAALIISWFLRKRVIIQTHGMFFRDDRIIDRFFNMICKEFAKPSDYHLILTESEFNWFETNRWRPTRLKIRNPVMISTSNISEKTFKYDVCFLSRFHARKRPLILIEAIKILSEQGMNLKVRMAGSDEGELKSCIEKIQLYSLEHVIEISSQISEKGISKILFESKIMVLPSFAEFVPMIILESLANGVPVIAGRDCELAQELVRSNSCLLADDPFELAKAIAELLYFETKREDLSELGYNWVKQNCEFTEVGLNLLGIYSDFITQEKN